jgi:carotenoid cleavage dioxygenase-like enzyme
MCHIFAGEKFDETYSWSIVKYDSELGDISATWGPNMTLAQEVRFIPNPEGKSEDDGILLTIAYNFDVQVTSLYVIDAKTMLTLQEYPLPYRLS